MPRFQPQDISSLPIDSFSSPYIPSKASHQLIEIDVSLGETQTFLIDLNSSILYVESYLWAQSQLDMVWRAIKEAQHNKYCTSILTQKTILMGVWHFGHFTGDHLHRLIPPRTHLGQCPDLPIHISANHRFIQEFGYLFNSSICEGMSEEISCTPRQKVRIYRLNECMCFFPATIKAVPLSMGHCFLQKSDVFLSNMENQLNILLTSGRSARILNIKDVAKQANASGWIILNPIVTPLPLVLKLVANAKQLVSENGSILFNCFLARSKPYFVLASSRCRDLDGKAEAGGGVYNKYHESVAYYIYCDLIEKRHHPYSDQISISDPIISYLWGAS